MPAKIQIIMFLLTCILPASHLPAVPPYLPTSARSDSNDYTIVFQEFLLQAEIPIDKAQMSQKGQIEKNVTFYLAHCPTFLIPLPEFSFILESGLISKMLEISKCFPLPFPILSAPGRMMFGLEGEGTTFFDRGRGGRCPAATGRRGPLWGVPGQVMEVCSHSTSWKPDPEPETRAGVPNLFYAMDPGAGCEPWTLLRLRFENV